MRFRVTDTRERRQRWRWRFALFPIRIHNEWVWLEWYRFRGSSVSWDRATSIETQDIPYHLVSF